MLTFFCQNIWIQIIYYFHVHILLYEKLFLYYNQRHLELQRSLISSISTINWLIIFTFSIEIDNKKKIVAETKFICLGLSRHKIIGKSLRLFYIFSGIQKSPEQTELGLMSLVSNLHYVLLLWSRGIYFFFNSIRKWGRETEISSKIFGTK